MKRIAVSVIAVLILLSGCAPRDAARTETFFAMDTVVTSTAYGNDAGTALMNIRELSSGYDSYLSVTDPGSAVSLANASGGRALSDAENGEALLLVADALEMSDLTGGAFDITIYPVVRAWGFTTDENRVPPPEELAELMQSTGFRRVEISRGPAKQVAFPEKMAVDLGAATKGYVGDRLNIIMNQYDASAVINLGGDVITHGQKPDGSDWRIAVRDPAGEDYFGVVSVEGGCAVMTSGGYERYFTGEDGRVYHHIIDPSTGYPADSGLVSVTVVASGSRCGFYADAISTAAFVMGKDSALEFRRGLGGRISLGAEPSGADFDLILVTDGGEVVITKGLEGRFELTSAAYTLVVAED